ncbi:Hydroxyacylglutathione hydrolase [Thalassoporum mexicanum PCC 7367]|uniref:hydroxyacylglutathione hydrolase n=1 Tax=Thalassoporum mexicanum TaxID=3457544 RepID=UPI00029FD507|nr:hydroxyacylglutathione hydrolase [Pseudanabaena sp. PCC 7367]AFY68899.1 Hydroxyacylglutathione hydrolase [Pseudanabaena sp. PCC 7367]
MDIYRLPVLNDNYLFVLHDRPTNQVAVVDPAVAEPVLAKLNELNANLVAIFNTHHHYDHIGANRTLKQKFPDLVIYGGELDQGRIPGQQVFLKDGDRVQFGSETAEVFFVPGHTRAHIAYYFPESGNLFCGDTLFAGGCGRLFEGTPAQMMHSLARLRQLPEATRVWCAHEYTLNNLQFAVTVDRNNKALMQRLSAAKEARAKGEATIPTTIGIEKQTNPFLRWDQPALQEAAKIQDPVRVFARIRGKKDLF